MLDLFAGSGVAVATKKMGITEHGVEIMPEAIATRDAAGFSTPYNDAWEIESPARLGLDTRVLWASPPCQSYSTAGRGAGRKALDQVVTAIKDRDWQDIDKLRDLGHRVGDDRTALVLTPLAYVHKYRPEFVAFEQVPTVLSVWEAHREPLEEMGYSVWVGYLDSENYSVAQSRHRAYLIARRDGVPAAPPAPRGGVRTMFDELGWGITDRPSPTLTSHLGVTCSPTGTQGVYLKAIERGAFIFKPGEPIPSKVATKGIGSLYAPNTINISSEEGGRLQSYPGGFPFQGSKTMIDLQIGNAVPPLVAEAVLELAPSCAFD